jgi:hypothetical protein
MRSKEQRMLTQERLRELIDYNPATGIAFWKAGHRCAGKRVGTIQRAKRSKPYRRLSLSEGWENKKNLSHVAFFYMTGQWPPDEVDHENGDTVDDRWDNLRLSTRAQNEANRGARRNSKSGIKGVFPTKDGRFRSEIYRCGLRTYLGIFATAQAAHRAYLAEAEKHDGEFLRAA